MAKNSVFHARMKHGHFIIEKVLQGEIEMKAIRTDDQVTDIFTKGLGAEKFKEFWVEVEKQLHKNIKSL